MTWKKTLFFTVIIAVTIGFILWTVMLFMAFGGVNILPSRFFGSLPEIQQAEFPFKLVYKINEDTFEVEDVLIGEFVRNKYNMGLGKSERVWKARLGSGKKYITLYLDEEREIIYQPTEDPNIISTFMGEKTVLNTKQLLKQPITLYLKERGNERFISVEELENAYNIKLISWQIAPPITRQVRRQRDGSPVSKR